MGQPKREFTAISPDGQITREVGVREFAARHGLTAPAIQNVLAGRVGTHKGWRFRDSTIHDPPAINEKPPPADSDTPTLDGNGLTRDQRIQRVRAMHANLVKEGNEILAGLKPMPQGWNPDRFLKLIHSECESIGITLERALDDRTDEDRVVDAIAKLCETPESMFAMSDEDLSAIESAMSTTLADGAEYIEDAMAKKAVRHGGADRGKASAARSVMRAWLSRLRRLRTIRQWITEPRPNEYHQWSPAKKLSWDATRTLRYQAYVGRSDASDAGGGGSATIFRFGRPHVKMAVDLYCARHRIAVTKDGVFRPGDVLPNGRTFPGIPYQGCMLLYPPRHGKTAFERHYVGLLMATEPRMQGAYIHARRDEASKFIKYVSDFFDPAVGTGARHLSLFPQSLADYDNNALKIRLSLPEPTSNPTLMGAGVWDQALGSNLDYIVFDDVVPQEDMTQQAERDRRVQRVSGTWLSRLQSKSSFFVLSGYPWHHDDVLSIMRQRSKRARDTNGREGQVIRVSQMAVGGPSTSPKFNPIWPEVWPASRLKQRYSLLADAALWSANFMLTPMTDEHRIVRKVKLYDGDSDEHRKYMEAAVIHLSLDPAMTKEEYSDYAGIVRVSIGDIETRRLDESGAVEVDYQRVIRVLDCTEIKNTQAELSDTIASMGRQSRVDLLHIETKGGGYAVIEFLERLHGITGVIKHNPGMHSKEIRFRAVASMIEDGAADIRPVVQFRGVMDSAGKLQPTESMKKLINYIVNFRATSGHHGLDALTQVLKYLSAEVSPGQGAVTVQAQRRVVENRKLRHLKERSDELSLERQQVSSFDMIPQFTGGFGA